MCKRFALVLVAVLVLSLFPSAATLALRAPLPAQPPPTGTGGEPPPALAQAGVTAGAWQRIVKQIRADQAQSGCSECASALDWTEQKKLLASDGAAYDLFGVSVAIWGDTVVVGAYGKVDYRASAYLFGRNQGGADNWGQIKKLITSDATAVEYRVWSVAIWDDTVVIGAVRENSQQGSAYLFARNQGGADNWGEVKELTASDGTPSDWFGYSVAIWGDTVVVGAYGKDSYRGSAYLFTRNQGAADSWGEVKKLTAFDGAADDRFGCSVAIWGDTVVIGAEGHNSFQGSAYLFARNQGGADNWSLVKQLTASDGTPSEWFGCSVAISGDTVVIGVPHGDIGGYAYDGSAYLFARNQGGPDNWGQLIKLTASDGAATDEFGVSVAISGDMVVIGAYRDDSYQGSAYLFARNQGGADRWGQLRKLSASDGAADDWFGWSVALWGDTVVVGAHMDDTGSNVNQGSAYVFTAPCTPDFELRETDGSGVAGSNYYGQSVAIWGDTVVVGALYGPAYLFARNQGGADHWGLVKQLTVPEGAGEGWFGWSVAISGGTVVVGAPRYENFRGSAYIFARNQGGVDNWGQVKQLTADDGAADDYFGYSVAIWGDTVVIGAQHHDSYRGSAYLFARNGGGADNWGLLKKLTATDGAAGDFFGYSVAIWGDTVVVGAWGDDAWTWRGSAYLFARNQGGADHWGQVKQLTASDGAADDYFGCSVAIWGDTVVVGADNDDIGSNAIQGSAYIFARNEGGADHWGQIIRLTASDGAAEDCFGVSAAIYGDTVIVGAYGHDIGSNADQGSAYLFARNQGGADHWGQIIKLSASDGAHDDHFGGSAAIWGDTVVVGAYGDYGWAGSAYVFGCAQPGSFGVYLPLVLKGHPS